MIKSNTRRGQTQVENKNKSHSRMSLSGISTTFDNKQGGDPRLQPSGMTPNLKVEALNKDPFRALLRSGFTLIELLVVVLIIGLLAAVALPQYQKAVRKARMADIATTFNAISHAIDVWMLENDIQLGTRGAIKFLGTTVDGTLPLDIACDEQAYDICINKTGAWSAAISTLREKGVWFDGAVISRGKGNSTLAIGIGWQKLGYTGPWKLSSVTTTDDQLRKMVCQWWIENYEVELITGSARDYHQCE